MISHNIKVLTKYLLHYKLYFAIVLLSLITVALALLAIGHVFKTLVDSGLAANKLLEINEAVIFISGLIGVFAVGSFFRSYFINFITEKVTSNLRADVYNHLLKIEIAKFEELKIGDLVLRLGADIDNIGKLIVNFLSFFIRNLVMLCGASVLMFIQSPKMSLLVIFGVPILLFPLLKLSRHVRNLSRMVLLEQSKLAAKIEENFSAIRTLHAYNMQSYLAAEFANDTSSYIKHASKRLRARSLFFAIAIAIIAISITMVICVGSIDIVNGTMSSGQMISFIYYAIMVGMSAGGIAELFSEIQGPLASLERVIELQNLKTTEALNGKNLTTKNYNIIFDNVTFSYPSRSDIPILKNISLEVEHGKFTALVGKSGSGKSTILQVLMKFYQHQSGIVSIGDTDITEIDNFSLRSKIAYVQQEPNIFAGTIKANILMARPDATEKEIEQVASLCAIFDFANDLPQGLDTDIGEKGARISGGQKQRIAIARALLYKPEILLLDEATSAIDSDSEKILLNNISTFLAGKTIISIAHRICSIEKADKILVIKAGKLVNSGTHESLLRKSGLYRLLSYEQV